MNRILRSEEVCRGGMAGREFFWRVVQLFWVEVGLGRMRLFKAALAGFFVIVVGMFTAAVIAVSAVVLFVAQRLKRGGTATVRRPVIKRGDVEVIDVTATEVPEAR